MSIEGWQLQSKVERCVGGAFISFLGNILWTLSGKPQHIQNPKRTTSESPGTIHLQAVTN